MNSVLKLHNNINTSIKANSCVSKKDYNVLKINSVIACKKSIINLTNYITETNKNVLKLNERILASMKQTTAKRK
jgi:hypothetical protein